MLESLPTLGCARHVLHVHMAYDISILLDARRYSQTEFASITFGICMASSPVEGTVHGTKGSIKLHNAMHCPNKISVQLKGGFAAVRLHRQAAVCLRLGGTSKNGLLEEGKEARGWGGRAGGGGGGHGRERVLAPWHAVSQLFG